MKVELAKIFMSSGPSVVYMLQFNLPLYLPQ